jgi:hypothetical protein
MQGVAFRKGTSLASSVDGGPRHAIMKRHKASIFLLSYIALAACSREPAPQQHSAETHATSPQLVEPAQPASQVAGYAEVQLDAESLERMGAGP